MKNYESVEIEVIMFASEDIIKTSDGDGDIDLPPEG